MSKPQQTYQPPGETPLSEINRLLLIVHQLSDLLGLVGDADKFVTIWLVGDLPKQEAFPAGTREILSVLTLDQIPGWLARSVRTSNKKLVWNQFQTKSFETTTIVQLAAKRLKRAVPVAQASDDQVDPLEALVRKEYDPLAPNSLTEVQRVTTVARQKVGTHVTQILVQEVCTVIDAEQGCRQGEALRNALLAALEAGGSYEDQAYLARLVAAAKAAGFPLLLPAGAKRIAERLQSTGQPNPPAEVLPLLATVSEDRLLRFLRTYFSQTGVPLRFEDVDFGPLYQAMELQRFAVPAQDATEKKRIRTAISQIRQETGSGRHHSSVAVSTNGHMPLADSVDYGGVVATLAAAKALPDQVAAMEEHLLALIGEIVAAQPLYQVAPGLVETNPAELLKRLLAKAQQRLSPKSE